MDLNSEDLVKIATRSYTLLDLPSLNSGEIAVMLLIIKMSGHNGLARMEDVVDLLHSCTLHLCSLTTAEYLDELQIN